MTGRIFLGYNEGNYLSLKKEGLEEKKEDFCF